MGPGGDDWWKNGNKSQETVPLRKSARGIIWLHMHALSTSLQAAFAGLWLVTGLIGWFLQAECKDRGSQ